jgi:hypothetical protein
MQRGSGLSWPAPFSGRLDVDLAPTMVVPETQAWHDRYRVLHVVNVHHIFGKNIVHVVREVLITNSGQAVPDDSDSDTGVQLQSEIDTVEQSDCGAEGMPYSRHRRRWVLPDQNVHSLEHLYRGPVGYAKRNVHLDQERVKHREKVQNRTWTVLQQILCGPGS